MRSDWLDTCSNSSSSASRMKLRKINLASSGWCVAAPAASAAGWRRLVRLRRRRWLLAHSGGCSRKEAGGGSNHSSSSLNVAAARLFTFSGPTFLYLGGERSRGRRRRCLKLAASPAASGIDSCRCCCVTFASLQPISQHWLMTRWVHW